MGKDESKFPIMSLEQLFASARAVGHGTHLAALTVNFQLAGCEADCGTLTISRNPTATHWMITIGFSHGERYYARIAQGQTPDEALTKIERYCHWWLGI
jgi:hypothetical protein